MDVREKLEVIAHLGDHISYKEDIGICYDSALAKVIEDAYMELKNGVTIQKWIPVSERLPKKEDARIMDGYLPAIQRDKKPNIWKWTAVAKHPEYFTHWMPLPPAPEDMK